MAAGDFHIRYNSADTSAVPNAGGGNEDANWDALKREVGSIVTFSDPYFRLNTGIYLVMYSERFHTDDTTTNERIEIQGEIHQSGVGVVGGYGQDYIRKYSSQQDCVVSGQQIIEVTSDNTDYFIRFYRTDNSTTGTVNRVPGYGGLIVLELDNNDNFGLYSRSTTVSSSGTSWVDFTADTNDRQDTGFSNNGSGVITVTNAGRYLAAYSLDINQGGTYREEAQGRITVNGTTTVEVGTYSACYMRGSDGCQDGALTWIGIIDVAANDTLRVQFGAPLTAATINCTSGYFQLWQIPAAADEAIINATNGDQNAVGAFAWDTQPYLDTASFSYTNGDTNININQDDFILAFATTAQLAPDSPVRPYPIRQFSINNTNQTNMSAGYYHRNNTAGALTATVSNLMYAPSNASVEMKIIETNVTGTCTNDSGQFSILSLESLWGPYTYPPKITDVDTDEIITANQQNVVCTGANFGATQGTGKLELASSSDYATATKTTQSIDSWSDTSIQFDTNLGSIPEGTVYVFVTNNSGDRSAGFKIQAGLADYHTALLDLSPDHYWRLNNVYTDTGVTGPQRDMTSSVVGTWTFNTQAIADGNTHSLNMSSVTNSREIVDSPNMNITISSNERTIACWLQLNSVQQSLGAIWKEGGGVQNLAFLVGVGNVLLAQGADTPGNAINAQAWSDFRLAVGRPYHICMRYSLYENPKEFRLYIDGVEQTDTDGNPLGSGGFNSHSGDVGWGDPDVNLETGGTDISYAGMENAQISDFATWSDNSAGTNAGALDKTTEIRDILFRRGAIPDDTIASDTQSAMQAALDATSDSRRNWPLSYRISEVAGGGDLELTFTNKVFDSLITSHVEYRGSSTLTIVNVGTSNVDSAKCWSATGGTINVIETAPQKFNVTDTSGNPIPGVRINVYKSSDDTQLMSELTDENGDAQDLLFRYTGVGDTDVYFRARRSSKQNSFATTTGVNGTTEVITTTTPHNFNTGEDVVYSKNGGSANVGLTDGATYYVNNISSNTLSLHTTAADAIADTSRVDLTANGSETHLLTPKRYVPVSGTGTIVSTGLSVSIIMEEDTVATTNT